MTDPHGGTGGLVRELHRRGVLQSLAAYAALCVAAWGAVEVASDAFAVPSFILRFVILASACGVPVVAWASWTWRVEREVEGGGQRRGPLGTAIGASVALGTAALIAAAGGPRETETTGGDPQPRLAFLTFENRTGDPAFDALGPGAVDWIGTRLQDVAIVPVVAPQTSIAASAWVAEELRAGRGGDPIRMLGEETAADYVGSGSVVGEGDSLRFFAQVTRVADGVVITSVEPTAADRGRPTMAFDRLAERLAGGLALAFDERMAPGATAQQPPTLESYRLFGEGMDRYVRLASREALPYFDAAYAADSTFLVARFMAAMQYINMAEGLRADSVLRLVHARRLELSSYYRQVLDATLAFQRHDYDAARAASRRAALGAPGSKAFYDWGFQAVLAGRPREALDAFSRLEPGRGAMRGWTSYAYMIADAHHELGEYEAALSAALLSEELFPDRPVTNAMQVGRELAALGRLDAVDSLLAAARASVGAPETMGLDQIASIPNTLHFIGRELLAHGHRSAARDVLREAVDRVRVRETVDRRDREDSALLGRVLYTAQFTEDERGLLEDARALWGRVLEASPGAIEPLGRVAVLDARLGARDAARTSLEALSRLDPASDPDRIAHAWAARIASQLGDTDRAIREIEQAFGTGSSRGLWLHREPELEPLRSDPRFQRLAAPRG